MPINLTHQQMAGLENMTEAQRESFFKTPEGRAQRAGWYDTMKSEGGNKYRPEDIQYSSVMGPDGQLQSQYKYTAKTLDPNSMEAFQAMKGRALTQGPTQWAKLMEQQQRQEQKGLTDKAAVQARTALAQGRADMMSRGGMSTGARERMAGAGNRNLLMARQEVARAGAGQRQNILTEDEKQKMNMLGQVSGQEIGMGQFNTQTQNQESQVNLQTALADKAAKDQFEQNAYKMKMKEWANNEEAIATEEAKRNRDRGMFGASWICTRVHEVSPLHRDDWDTLLKLRSYAFDRSDEAATAYFYGFGPLIADMDAAGVDWMTCRPIIDRTMELIRSGDMQGAYDYYVSTVIDLAEKYWVKPTQDLAMIRSTVSLRKSA